MSERGPPRATNEPGPPQVPHEQDSLRTIDERALLPASGERRSLRTRIEAVAVGASAGGVEALSVLLPALPPGFRTPLIIALHLPRERPSLLVDIFQPRCRRPVREASDKDPIEPGTVYFAPPDYHLLIEDTRQFALSVDEPVHYSRPSIDVLFESAAQIYGSALLGILLTGANEDGADGIASIRGAGGVTVIQDPGSAQEPRMVLAALARGAVDFVLPLDDIAALLCALV